jgi:hypothetical protein
MRIHQYGQDLELRVQFPSGVTGLTSGQITTALYQSTDSSGGSGADTAINLSGLVGFSEVGSTGIYRINIDSTAFSTDPASSTNAVLYYAKVTESNSSPSTVVNVPMFEVTSLNEDQVGVELLATRNALLVDVDTAFAGRDATVDTLAEALGAIYDGTVGTDQANVILDEVISAVLHTTTDSVGARLYEISEALRSGGSVEALVSSSETKIGAASDTGSDSLFGLLAQILVDSGTTLPALINTLLGTPAGADVSTDIAAVKAETASALTKIGTSSVATSLAGDLQAVHDRVGAPVGADISADVASVQSKADLLGTTIGSPAGADVSTDIAAVKTDTASALTTIGTPAGANVSADIASVKGETASLLTNVATVQTTGTTTNTLLGTPAVDVSTDIAAVKGDASTLLTRLGSISSSASLSNDLFGAIKYLANQAQSQTSTNALPARASIQFPTALLAPQGVSNKYIRVLVQNRNRSGQLERTRALGDDGSAVNGSAVFEGTASASVHNNTITITVNSVTETWTFIDSQIDGTATSGLVSAGSGQFVFDSNDSVDATVFLVNTIIPTLRLTSALEANFDLDDVNTARLLVCPNDYETMSVVITESSLIVASTANSNAKAGVGAMFVRVLVDGVVDTNRFYKDALGADVADYSLAANSSSDGGLGRRAPAVNYAAMQGGDNAGEFTLYYKLSAGQQENLSFEIFGIDKNSNLDSLSNTTEAVVSEVIAVTHCTVQAPSLNQLGIAF